MIKNFFGKIFKRNYSLAQIQNLKSPTPIYNNWKVLKAVKEGYKSNVSVYRAVNLIVKNLTAIPWSVKNEADVLPDHHLSKLFNFPNPSISNNDLWELFYSWLELAGNAYGLKIKVDNRTEEIWPISPDRLQPMQGVNIEEWIVGYMLDKGNKRTQREFDPSEILHLKFFNPANPFLGIAPLQAAAKTVDVDNDQLSWMKSTMQNMGVPSGVFTFERPFESLNDADAISKVLNKKYGGKDNARKLAVLGGNAKYHRTSLTPQESDFSKSRKDNRNEIFIAFGIPPQLGGSQESSTYNNFEVSILIFWFSTLIPILDDIKAGLNFSFKEELLPGEKICYDLSGVQAIRKAMLDRAETAEKLFKMGVPFEQVNRIFEFGVEEFDGWEKSYVNLRGGSTLEDAEDIDSRSLFTLVEHRSIPEDEMEKESIKQSKKIKKLLSIQEKLIFSAIDKGDGFDAEKIIDSTLDEWKEKYTKLFIDTGVEFGKKIVVEKRQIEDPLTLAIEVYLEEEVIVLTELSLINKTTSELITKHVSEGLQEGYSTAEIQQAILDSGTFSEARALRLARTITGNAANVGQLLGAQQTGANKKTWITAGFDVRDTHAALEGITIDINDTFNVGGFPGRYPLDNRLPPGERCNCRCSLSYSIE